MLAFVAKKDWINPRGNMFVRELINEKFNNEVTRAE
jgi:hypothetical protein